MTTSNSVSESNSANNNKDNFLIVGIGASAGGVEALKEFFLHVPEDSGMAYVVILHLSPEHDSYLASILQQIAKIPVTQLTERKKVKPDHMYVISPNHHLEMIDGDINVTMNTSFEERRAPVDIFFRTLAESHDARAVAVVLSGTGANGSMGIKRIKERGGVAFVQNPREAQFKEMPQNSIATDLIDDVLPVAEIPAKIISYKNSLGTVTIPKEPEDHPDEQQRALREIFLNLRLKTGHDFSNYKTPTMLRRIERRMNVRNMQSLPAYADFTKDHPDEIHSLLKDLLISVTNFFRDAKAFEAIEKDILPAIIKDKRVGDQIRIWVAGCATGEEAYSIAMLCAEKLLGVPDAPQVQIFATDIDEDSLNIAREGIYTLNDAADVSPERLRRFFNQQADGYHVRSEIREMVLFAQHNVLKDPPFSRLHLATCRNMLIYLNRQAQQRVMETLHFALLPGSYLFLGASESVEGAGDLYSVFNREQHIYQSRQVTTRVIPYTEGLPTLTVQLANKKRSNGESGNGMTERVSFGDLHQQLLEQYAPPSLIVNENYEVLHLSPTAGRFLQHPGGEPSSNLLKLVLPELRLELRMALYNAVQQQINVQTKPVSVHINEKEETVRLQVRPALQKDNTAKGFLLILFEPAKGEAESGTKILISDEQVARQLEDELARTKEQLHTSTEQHEVQSEELRAANEELQALNEELRSAAEELETGKEELQSINEELRTVNQELKIKIEEIPLNNNNLQNLINSTSIGTIFLDRSFRVVFFTPATRDIFNLIPADIGRPLSDITNKLTDDGLLADAETVLFKLQTIEREVRTSDGKQFMMRLLPYRTAEDHINGVVATFIDVTQHRQTEAELEKQRALLVRAMKISSMGWGGWDRNTGKAEWSENGKRLMGFQNEEEANTAEGWMTYIHPDDLPKVQEHAARAAAEHKDFDIEYRIIHPGGDVRWLHGTGKIFYDKDDKPVSSSGFIYDITERRRRDANLIFLADLFENAAARPAEGDIIKEVCERLANYLQLDGYTVCEVDEKKDTATVKHVRTDAGETIQTDTCRIADYMTEDLASAMRAGETRIVYNTKTDNRTDAEPAAAGSGAYIAIPYNREGEWRGCFTATSRAPRHWTTDEVDLMQEASRRMFQRVERARTEEALRKSEERFRSLIHTTSDVVYKMSADWGVMSNLKGMDFIADTETPIEQWIDKYIPLLAQAGVQAAIRQAIETKSKFELEHQVLRADGSIGWTYSRAVPLLNEDNEITEWFGAATDITERKGAVEALREGEERLRLATTAADIYSWEFDTETGEYSFSDNAASILGVSELPRTVEDTYRLVHPEDKQLIADTLERAIATSKGYTVDFRSVKDDGSIVWLSVQTTMLRETEGKALRLLGIAQDISERKEAEDALRYSETKLRIVMKASRIGTWLWNIDENKYEPDVYMLDIFGNPPEGISRIEQITSRVYEPDVHLFGDAVAKASDANGRGTLNFEYRITGRDGSLRWIHSIGQTFFDGTPKRAVMMIGSMTDITERKEAEVALRESEERFSAFFNQSTAGVVEYDTDGRILFANETFCRLLAYKPEEMKGMDIMQFTHPESLARCLENLTMAVEKGHPSTIEKMLIRADDSHIWITESIAPLSDKNGIIKSVLGVGIDVTERKKTEMFVRESEERYRVALEAGELATWDWNLKTDTVAWNEQHFRLFGTKHEGNTIEPEYFLKFIYPEDLAIVKQQLGEVVGGGGIYTAEFRIRRQDNGRLRWMSGYGRVTERENGKPVRISGVMYDSTDRREAEDNLTATKNSLNTALEAAKMGVWSMDMQTGDVDRSARHDELLGFRSWQEQWTAEKAKTHIIKEDKPEFDAAYQSLLEEGVFDLKARVKQRDGNVCWVHYYGRTFTNEDGKGETAAGVIYDITDQKTIEKQKDEFIGIASHELKTPVTSIKAYAEILREMFTEKHDDFSADLMNKLDGQVDRLTNLIKDLLDVTKVSEGQLHLVTKPFSMERMVKDVVEEIQRTTRQHRIKMTLASLPEAVGDEERLSQVLTNLLSNAIKYSPEAKDVLVEAALDNGSLSIRVQDYGIGMSPGTLEKLFGRFFRSDNPSVRSYPGLGLGLFISMEIMKRHGGTIAVESERGKGSVFTMILPLV